MQPLSPCSPSQTAGPSPSSPSPPGKSNGRYHQDHGPSPLPPGAETEIPSRSPLKKKVAVKVRKIGPKKSKKIRKEWSDVCALRESILMGRVREANGLDKLKYLRRHAQDTRADFSRLLNSAIALGNFAQVATQLKELAEKVQIAEETLGLEEQDWSRENGHLLTLGHQLQMKDSALRIHIGDILPEESKATLYPPRSPSVRRSSISSIATSLHSDGNPTDPLLTQLFSCIGDISVQKERLHKLESSHIHDLEIRNRRKGAGKASEQSDAHFFNDYYLEYQNTTEEILDLKREVRRLKSLCRQRGLDFSQADDASEVSSVANSVTSEDGEIGIAPPAQRIQDSFPGFFLKPGFKLLTMFKDQTDRINRWLMYGLQISRFEIRRLIVESSDLPNEDQVESSPGTDSTDWSYGVYSTWPIEEISQDGFGEWLTSLEVPTDSSQLTVISEPAKATEPTHKSNDPVSRHDSFFRQECAFDNYYLL